MGVEIERKFLIDNDGWRAGASKGVHYRQGYFTTIKSCSIRVRIAGKNADLNIKSATLGIFRAEYNYPIPVGDAEEMLQHLCTKPLIVKTRYRVQHDQHVWEVDVFTGENEGLVVAEVELDSITESFTKPGWVGREVSDDPRYYNVCLVEKPFTSWPENR
jgi:adenylate cyclase